MSNVRGKLKSLQKRLDEVEQSLGTNQPDVVVRINISDAEYDSLVGEYGESNVVRITTVKKTNSSLPDQAVQN